MAKYDDFGNLYNKMRASCLITSLIAGIIVLAGIALYHAAPTLNTVSKAILATRLTAPQRDWYNAPTHTWDGQQPPEVNCSKSQNDRIVDGRRYAYDILSAVQGLPKSADDPLSFGLLSADDQKVIAKRYFGKNFEGEKRTNVSGE